MSKQSGSSEQSKDQAQAKDTAHAPVKKPEGGGHKKGGYEPLPGGCLSPGCKTPAKRFSFCDEHFDQFKFGLIKKTGEPVPDYEKKYEHYMAFVAKKKASRAA